MTNPDNTAQLDIRSILIVGGGSAGWITACLLAAYAKENSTKNIEIHLVESPNIPIMGVGEATIPSIRNSLAKMGMSEKDFMEATGATFKNLIRFNNWNLGETFDHPFDRRDMKSTEEQVKTWLELGRSGEDFAKQFSLLSHTSDRNLAPKAIGWPDYNSAFPYAYHLDAVKLAHKLSEIGQAKGIKHSLATVDHVEQSADGAIDHIVTEKGEKLSADLYIDCTGFKAALISKLSPEVIDYSDQLLCDRAVTVQVPYDVYKPDAILPYTNATARSAGWNWDINLQNRRGIGYVYSSQFLSEQEAEAELREFEGVHCQDLPVRHIKFKTYKRKKSWVKNCLSIGLSDCFMEPLESSGIFMIEFATHLLGAQLASRPYLNSGTIGHFNRKMEALSNEVRDFVLLHYLTSNRDDTEFWREASKVERAPEHLADLLEEWKHRHILETDFIVTNRIFSFQSYEFLLYGSGHCRPQPMQNREPFTHSIQNSLEKCFATLPIHEKWLQTLSTSAE